MTDKFVKLAVGEKRTYFAETKFWSIERTGKTSTQVLYGANGQGKRITNHGYHTESQMTALIKSKLRKGYVPWADPSTKGNPANKLVVGNMYLISPIVSPATEQLWPMIIGAHGMPDPTRWTPERWHELSNEHVVALGPYQSHTGSGRWQKVLHKEAILYVDMPIQCFLEVD